MDILAPLKRVDDYQQHHNWLGIPLAVVKKFGDDQGGSLAALVAYFGFFSLFPLILVMTTILGFVLHGDPHAQQAVAKSVLGQFPVIGDKIKGGTLTGSVTSLVIGLVTSTLGGLGVTSAAQNALDRVWAVPFKSRPDFLRSRLRGLAVVGLIGLLFLISTVVSGLISGIHGPVGKVGAILAGLALNFGIFLAAFRMLTAAVVPMRSLWVGVITAAAFWELLQFFGGLYVNHVLRHLSSVSSQFGLVLGLLAFMHLGAQLTLYAAELNVVLERKLYPRTLIGPPEGAADAKTLRALAKVEERHDLEEVEVEFHPLDEDGNVVREEDAKWDADAKGAGAPAGRNSHGGRNGLGTSVVRAAAFGAGIAAGLRSRSKG